MNDISIVLKRVAAKTHDVRSAVRALRRLVRGTETDWDEGAGEEWVRLLKNKELVAVVHQKMPLAFIRAESASLASTNTMLSVVSVPSFSRPVLNASFEALRKAFPNDVFSEEFDGHGFSVGDLYWETV